MGQYFIVVNPAKREYLDASRFDENVKNDGAIFGWHGMALGLLIRNAWSKRPYPLIGSWAGDPVLTCGDYAPAFPPGCEALAESGNYPTLYALAEAEFQDISDQAILMLCLSDDSDEAARMLVAEAKTSAYLLAVLGDITLQFAVERLHRALFFLIGPDWFTQYQHACRHGGSRRLYGYLEYNPTLREQLLSEELEWQRELED